MRIYIFSTPFVPSTSLADKVVGNALRLILQRWFRNQSMVQDRLIVTVQKCASLTGDAYHLQIVPQATHVLGTLLHYNEFRSKRWCLYICLLLWHSVDWCHIKVYKEAGSRSTSDGISGMVGINVSSHNKSKPSWHWHICRQFFLSVWKQFRCSPIFLLKLSFVYDRITGIEYHFIMMILSKIIKDMEHLFQVSFTRKGKVQGHHIYFTS